MKFPSLKSLGQSLWLTARRFPLELFFATAGSIAATVRVELKNLNGINENWCWRVIMIANLGFLLSFAVSLFSENSKFNNKQTWILKTVATCFAITLLFVINPYERNADTLRFFVLSFSFHLLVAFAAFTKPGNVQGFWQFNKAIFLRFLTSFFYSIVLFIGLSAAVTALNFLFNFKFEWDTYSILWIWIAGMFSTVFFLAGVPVNFKFLNEDQSYPAGLKKFTQFVLIPLATIYLSILLAYEVKIILQWRLPKGYVSSLILSYAVFGILSLLLIYPIRNGDENKWIKSFSKSFYLFMLPLLVLLFLAMYARVSHYGITEYRFFLILLALWLLFTSLYFLLSAKQNIKLIPVTLCALALLSTYGPQSAFNVALKSQLNILKGMFERKNAFKNGILMPIDKNKFSNKDDGTAVAALDYVISHYDLNALQPYLKYNLSEVKDSLSKIYNIKNPQYSSIKNFELHNEEKEWVEHQLNLRNGLGSTYSYNNTRSNSDPGVIGESFDIKIYNDDVTLVRGFDYVLDVNTNKRYNNSDTLHYTLKGDRITQIKENNSIYSLKINDEPKATFNLQPKLDSITKSTDLKNHKDKSLPYKNTYIFGVKDLSITKHIGKRLIIFKINQLNCVKESGSNKNKLIYANAVYLIKL